MPAKAGIQCCSFDLWIPAFAGMTRLSVTWLYEELLNSSSQYGLDMPNSLQKRISAALIIAISMLLSACQQRNSNQYQGYVEGELIFMASPYSGNVNSLTANRGEYVKQGQLLFALDPEPEKSQLDQAQKQLQEAQASLKNLIIGQRETILKGIEAQINQTTAQLTLDKNRLDRTQTLYDKKVLDKDSLDAARSNYQARMEQLNQFKANLAEAKLGGRDELIAAQKATVAAAQAKVNAAIWILQQKTIKAPLNALVFDTYFKQSEWVAQGKPVLSLLAAENIRIIFYVPETVLSKIHSGQSVQISCDSCHQAYPAVINYISPEAEYTPPLIYSRENNYKLVYRIKAIPSSSDAMFFHPGQPVYITLKTQENK